jgi:hypothetical protein
MRQRGQELYSLFDASINFFEALNEVHYLFVVFPISYVAYDEEIVIAKLLVQ